MGFQNEDDYPIVLVPEQIVSVLENGIYDEDVEIAEPKLEEAPVFPSRPWNTISKSKKQVQWLSVLFFPVQIIIPLFLLIPYVASAFIGFFLLSSWLTDKWDGVFNQYLPWGIIVIPILWVIVACINAYKESPWIESESYAERKPEEQIKAENEKYELAKKEWYQKDVEVKRRNELKLSAFKAGYAEKVNKAKILKFEETVAPEVSVVESSDDVKRGTSEAYFEEILREHFDDDIKVNQVTEDQVFYPDFVYVCPYSGIHIDIEIDEPYTLKKGKPIHYVGCGDEDRNDYFVSNNWCVVRFTEEQVVESADKCIYLLKVLLGQLEFELEEYCGQVYVGGDFSIQKRWKKKKAKKMAKKGYREWYLSEAGLI